MRVFKDKATPEEICAGNRCSCLLDLCREAYSYEYEATPRYGTLMFILENELIKMNVYPD